MMPSIAGRGLRPLGFAAPAAGRIRGLGAPLARRQDVMMPSIAGRGLRPLGFAAPAADRIRGLGAPLARRQC
jgi:hypothetical protein